MSTLCVLCAVSVLAIVSVLCVLCRALLTQEGICLNLSPEFHFLEVAYPYVARRLLTAEDPILRDRLFQVCSLNISISVHDRLCALVTLLYATAGKTAGVAYVGQMLTNAVSAMCHAISPHVSFDWLSGRTTCVHAQLLFKIATVNQAGLSSNWASVQLAGCASKCFEQSHWIST